jgi:hypothetical protein
MRETIRFAKRLDPDYATFSVTVPYAGTEMYADGLAKGIIPHDYWLDFARQPSPNFVVPYFWEEHLNKEQLLKIRDEATRAFYFRPKYIVKQLRQSGSIGEIRRKGAMAFGLFQASVLGRGRRQYIDPVTGGATSGFANNLANPRSVRQ